MRNFIPMTEAELEKSCKIFVEIEKLSQILARNQPGDEIEKIKQTLYDASRQPGAFTCLPNSPPLRNPLPIVGRTVQFFGSAWRTGMPPLAALITAVHSDCSVWLAVFEPDGRPWETIRGPCIVGPPPVRFVKPEEPEPHRDARTLYAENPGNPLPAFEPFCKYPPE